MQGGTYSLYGHRGNDHCRRERRSGFPAGPGRETAARHRVGNFRAQRSEGRKSRGTNAIWPLRSSPRNTKRNICPFRKRRRRTSNTTGTNPGTWSMSAMSLSNSSTIAWQHSSRAHWLPQNKAQVGIVNRFRDSLCLADLYSSQHEVFGSGPLSYPSCRGGGPVFLDHVPQTGERSTAGRATPACSVNRSERRAAQPDRRFPEHTNRLRPHG